MQVEVERVQDDLAGPTGRLVDGTARRLFVVLGLRQRQGQRTQSTRVNWRVDLPKHAFAPLQLLISQCRA